MATTTTSSTSAGTTPDGRFCARHTDVKVRRKDLLKVTEIGCWKCKMDDVWHADDKHEEKALEELEAALAKTKGKDRRKQVIGGAIEAIRSKEAQLSIENQVLQKKVVDLQKENLEVLKKWQEAKLLQQEAAADLDHKDSQLERTMEALETLREEKEEADQAIAELQQRVTTLETEREAMRTEALEYASHIKGLEDQLDKIIAKQGLAEKVPISPVKANAPSISIGLEPAPQMSPRATRPSNASKDDAHHALTSPPPTAAGGSSSSSSSGDNQEAKTPPVNRTSSLSSGFVGFFKKPQRTSFENKNEQPPQQQHSSENKEKDSHKASTPPATTENKPKGVTFAANNPPPAIIQRLPGEEAEAGESPKKPQREKISIVAHMNHSDRINFKMYKDDPFQRVMERYLKVKNIECPLDEVRFVIDGKHALLPELRPIDFELQDGATINVIVPEEYLPEK